MPTITVSTPAVSRGLILLATLKDELGITDSASDTKLARWIEEETDRICNHCGVAADQLWRRTFAAEVLAVAYDPSEVDARDRKAPLILPWRVPVTAVAGVVEGGVALTADDYQLLPTAALLYRLDADGAHTDWAKAAITLTMTAGWDLSTEAQPKALRRACLELVRARWLAGNRDPNLKVDDVAGVGRQEYWVNPASPDADGLPSEIAAMVQPYTAMAV